MLGNRYPSRSSARWIEITNQLSASCGGQKRVSRAEAGRLEQVGHLPNRESLAEGHRSHEDVATGETIDDLGRSRRDREPVLAGLQAALLARQSRGDTEGQRVGHDARLGQSQGDGRHADAGWQVDEHLVAREATVRGLDPLVHPPRGAGDPHDGHQEQQTQLPDHSATPCPGGAGVRCWSR